MSFSFVFVALLELVNDCRAGLADDLVLGIRAARTADCADDRPPVDQWNTPAGRDHSVEREQIVQMHQVDAVLEYLGWAPESRCCLRLVFRDLDRGKHRAIHSLEGNQVAPGIHYGDVHLPIPLRCLRDGCVDGRLSSGKRYGSPIRHVEWHFLWDDIKWIRRREP